MRVPWINEGFINWAFSKEWHVYTIIVKEIQHRWMQDWLALCAQKTQSLTLCSIGRCLLLSFTMLLFPAASSSFFFLQHSSIMCHLNPQWSHFLLIQPFIGLAMTCCLLFCLGFNMVLYIKMVKRRIVLFVCLFPGMLLLFLIGKYGHLPAE